MPRILSHRRIAKIFYYFSRLNNKKNTAPLTVRAEGIKNLQNLEVSEPQVHQISVFFIPLTSMLCFLIRCHRLRWLIPNNSVALT